MGWHFEGIPHWIKPCSWPTLGLCSLPCFWASHLKAPWPGLLCTASLRSSPRLEHQAQAAILCSAGLAVARCSLLNNIWLHMRRLRANWRLPSRVAEFHLPPWQQQRALLQWKLPSPARSIARWSGTPTSTPTRSHPTGKRLSSPEEQICLI